VIMDGATLSMVVILIALVYVELTERKR